jgi:DeoR/GlpR family transcriptional regulator of sugar metabolism
MLTGERKAHILDVLRRDRRVIAKAVSQELGLSEDTIRRDLRDLASEGLLQRVHGGALPASPATANLAGRLQVSTEGKAAIGRAAARMIRPGQIIMIDGGTTTAELVRHLNVDLKATVVTHSPTIAVALADHTGIEVELIGGRLFRHSMVTVGAVAIEAISRVRADIYFMGVTGIHPEIGLTTGDREEASTKRILSQHAAETVVLASREKLGAASPFQVMPIGEVETIIVESGLPPHEIELYRQARITIVSA